MAADEAYTRESVVELIERLVEELRSRDIIRWENTTLDFYLDALGGWLSDCRGYYRNNFDADVPENPWRVISDALEAARTYE